MRRALLCLVFLLFQNIAHAATPAQCDELRAGIRSEIDRRAAPLIKGINNAIKELKDHNIDPANYYLVGKGTVNFYAALEEAYQLRNAAIERVEQDIVPRDCDDSQLAQDITNVAIVLVMPIALVFPHHFYIDANTVIQDGKIFGGDSALVPHIRDVVLGKIGVGGSGGDIIRDPIQQIIVKPICRLLRC